MLVHRPTRRRRYRAEHGRLASNCSPTDRAPCLRQPTAQQLPDAVAEFATVAVASQ
jgi:hypothetical protein